MQHSSWYLLFIWYTHIYVYSVYHHSSTASAADGYISFIFVYVLCFEVIYSRTVFIDWIDRAFMYIYTDCCNRHIPGGPLGIYICCTQIIEHPFSSTYAHTYRYDIILYDMFVKPRATVQQLTLLAACIWYLPSSHSQPCYNLYNIEPASQPGSR